MNLVTSCAERLDLPLDAAVDSGDFVAEGEAIIGFAETDGDIVAGGYVLATSNELLVEGVPKATGTAWVLGDRLSNNGTNFLKSATLDVVAYAAEAATSGAAVGNVVLLPAPMINPARLTAVETLAGNAATEAARVLLAARVAVVEGSRHTVRIPVTANAAPTFLWAPPFAGTVTGIKVACTTTIASTGGTVTLAAIKVGGNTLLATAATTIEGTVGAAAPATVPLTATGADLILAATDVVKLTVTSDNADATGGADLIAIITMTPA